MADKHDKAKIFFSQFCEHTWNGNKCPML